MGNCTSAVSDDTVIFLIPLLLVFTLLSMFPRTDERLRCERLVTVGTLEVEERVVDLLLLVILFPRDLLAIVVDAFSLFTVVDLLL
jgi:hypothetical protein